MIKILNCIAKILIENSKSGKWSGFWKVPYKGTLNILGGTLKTTTDNNRISGDSANGIGVLNIGDAAGHGNGTMIVTKTLAQGLGTATLNMNSGTLRVGTASFSGVTTNYFGGTFQANNYTGTLVAGYGNYFSNIGTAVEIATDTTSDFRTTGTMAVTGTYQQVKSFKRTAGTVDTYYRGGVKSSISFDIAANGACDKLTATTAINLEVGSVNLYTPALSTLTANTTWDIMDGTINSGRKANFYFVNRSSADNMNWAFNSTDGTLTYKGALAVENSWTGGALSAKYATLTSTVNMTAATVFTDSIVVIGKNGVLNLNTGARPKILATNNIATAMYLEDGGRINYNAAVWAGPTSQDASFIMTGGELNFGNNANAGFVVKGGSLIFTGGKAGNLSGSTLQAGGRIHLNDIESTSDTDDNAHMIVDGTAEVYLAQLDFGFKSSGKSALLEVKGGTLKTTTLNIGIDSQLSNTSNYEMVVSGGKMVVTSSVGGYNSDYFVMTLKGGTLDLPSLTTNSNLKLNLQGGTLMIDTVTGDLVNNGSDVQITSAADAAASTAGKMTVSGKYVQNEGSLNLDVDSTGKADTMTASSFEFNGGSVNVNYAYTGTDAKSWTFLTGTVSAMNADVTLNTNVPLAGNRNLTYADGTLTLSSLPDSSATWTGSDLNGQYASIAEKTININEDAEIANSVIALGDGAVLNVASGVDANFTADSNLLASLYVNDGGELNIGHAQGTGTTSVANLYQASGSTVNLYSDALKVGSYTAATGSTLNLKGGTFQANQFTGDLTNTASNIALDGAMTISGKYTQKLNGSVTFDLAAGDKISATSLDLSAGTLYVNNPSASTLTAGQSWDIMDGTVSNRRANFVFQNRTSADNMNWSFDSTSGELKYVGKLTEVTSWSGADLTNQYVRLTSAVGLNGTNKGTLTDSTLVIASGGKLTLNDGSRLKILSSSNVAAAMYLEDGGQIIVNNTTKTGVWFGPSSKDATFYMTGGSMNLGTGEGQGFIVNDGSAFITGGKVGTFNNKGELTQGGMIHVSGSNSSNQNSHLTIGGTAEVNVTTLQMGHYTDDPSGSLDITGGKVTIGTFRISSQNPGAASRDYVARISGGDVNVTNLYVGTQKNGSLALTGGTLKVENFTKGTNGTFDLLGGTFQAKNYSGSFVNDGATIQVDEKMTLSSGFTQESGRIEIEITSTDAYDMIQATQFDLNGGDLYLKFEEGFESPQASQKFDVFDGMLNYIAENFQVLTEGLGKQYSVSFTTAGLYINNSSASGVPEPATWVLLLLGLVGLGAARRTRQ